MQLIKVLTLSTLVTVVAASAIACSSNGGSTAGSVPGSSAPVAPAALRGERVAKAARALTSVRSGLVRGGADRLGLSAAEIDRASMSDEIPVFYVGLAQLRANGSIAKRDLGEPTEHLVPVTVDGEVRSLVSLSRDANGEWGVTGVGRARFAKELDAESKKLLAKRHPNELAVIVVPELTERFLAHEEGSELFITAMHDVNGAHMARGESVPARLAFARLAALRAD